MSLQCLREHFDSAAAFTWQAGIRSLYTQTYSDADNTVMTHEMGSSKRHSCVEWCAYHLEHELNGYTNLTANAHKNATLHKTPEVLGPRVRRRGSLSASIMVSQGSSAVRGPEFFSLRPNGNVDFPPVFGLAILKTDSPGGGNASKNPRGGRVYCWGGIWDIFSVLVFKDI